MDDRSGGRRQAGVFTPPLKVHLCWFDNPDVDKRCAEIARELYEFLHRPLADDGVLRPGLEIPVEYGRSLQDLLDALGPADKRSTSAEPDTDTRLVVVLLDESSYLNNRDTVAKAIERWPDASPTEVFLPIVLHDEWFGVLPTGATTMLAAIRAGGTDLSEKKDRQWKLGSEVAVVAGRALLRRLHDQAPPKPKVFISHAKADGRELTRELVKHFRLQTQVEVWFDETDVPRGEELGNELRKATSDGVVLVVRTDSYSESPWCALELLNAKLEKTPMVTLLATSAGEPVASAYGGNHRTMTWKAEREWELVARCVQAWLHGHHFRAHARAALARAGLPAESEIIPRRPELLDLLEADADRSRPLLVHPDPPLTEAELKMLRQARPSVRLATPSTLFGRVLLENDPLPPLAGTTLAFSLSVAPEVPRLEDGKVGTGQTQEHVNDVIFAIVLATLHSGARIAYGGDLRDAFGYAKQLSDLHRSRRRLGVAATSQLTCFFNASGEKRQDKAAKVEYDPVKVAEPPGASEFPDVRSILWHLAMRQELATRSSACVMIGGKSRASVEKGDTGYVGPWPGLLEEAWRHLDHGNALFVVGGFGGAAGAIARMLENDEIPAELTSAGAGPGLRTLATRVDEARTALKAHADARADVLMEHDGGFAGIDELARRVLGRWKEFISGKKPWGNELTRDENLRLFRSTDRTEIAHLVFEGLRRCSAKRESKLKLALYYGDIATAPSVDAYAVTVTPGARPVGASAAIDRRMNGQLADYPWAGDELIATVPIKAAGLSGSRVLVGRLPLLAPGANVEAAQVKEIAAEVARRADRLGVASIAVVPFGTTMGLGVADSVMAMRDGFRESGSLSKTIVFCETDRARYELMREALASSAEVSVSELPAGPSAIAVRTDTMLNVDVTPPTSEDPTSGRIRATMYVPNSAKPVVPLHDAPIVWADWYTARKRDNTLAETLKTGKKLWRDLLSEPMQKAIEASLDRSLVVVASETASGLPWEVLTTSKGDSLALRGGVVRRIALTGAVTEPSQRTGMGTRLRVLLVTCAKRLKSVQSEIEEVEKALEGRAEVTKERLVDPKVDDLRRELASGYYDALHYAGHASFNALEPAASGLELMDGVFTGAHLEGIPAPRLVFLSACESGRLRQEEQPDETPAPTGKPLAEAFLRNGVAALVGTFFAVDDRSARAFAATVYSEMAAGQNLGVAIRTARQQRNAAEDPDWANFLLYGDDGLVL